MPTMRIEGPPLTVMSEETNTVYELLGGRKRSRYAPPRSSVDLSCGPDRNSSFRVFLAYVPVLISFLTVGLLIWMFQSTTEKDLEAIRSSLYSLATSLIRMETRIDEIQRLAVESKVSKVLLEERFNRLSKQIASLESNAASNGSRLSSRPSTKSMHSTDKAFYHEVQTGDTLYGIARKYGLTVKQLLAANNLNDKAPIYPGQKILIISDQHAANDHSS